MRTTFQSLVRLSIRFPSTACAALFLLTVATWITGIHSALNACPANSIDSDSVSGLHELCSRLQTATVRVISGTDRSSGVIVSDDGHILTVAHGLHHMDGAVSIIFHDGARSAADILLRDTTTDVAVLKIKRNADTKFTPIRFEQNSAIENTQLVLAAGYPGREKNGLSPVLRIGQVLAVEPELLRSSCILTAGDSGGPLINHRGELIGIHRQIGLGRDSNLHLRTDVIRSAIRSIPELQHLTNHSSQQLTAALPLQVPAAGPEVLKHCQQRTVEIRCGQNSMPSITLGTLLDSSHVATKLSELVPGATLSCRFADGRESAAIIFRISIPMDTAILQLAVAQPNADPLPVASQPIPQKNAGTSHNRTRFVFASIGLNNVSRTGIMTRWTHSETRRPGKLGAVMETTQRTGPLLVTSVAPNSTAAAGEIVSGDTLLKINNLSTTTLDDVSNILTKAQPGDWLSLQFSRGMDVHETFARFQHDPGEQFERTEFLDGRSGQISLRRTGFENVIQHDVPLTPDQCGGPLCDDSGQIIAVNIARRAREASLAIPIELLLQLAAIERSGPAE